MGLYDRDYGRNERTPWDRVENPRSFTITLLVINCVVFFADMILELGLEEWFSVKSQSLAFPWYWWQLLTYGFLHDTEGIRHILFNMIGLFCFGRAIEQRLGRMEFLRFYLLAIVAGGVIGSVTYLIQGALVGDPLQVTGYTVGASGGVIAIAILFACFYPNQEILLMFVLPVKAWVVAVAFVLFDIAGAIGAATGVGPESSTAFTVHLAGAGFALAYYFRRWNLKWLNFAGVSDIPRRLRQRSRRMKLKLHDPDRKMEQEAAEADRILGKIHESGESSLTASERKTLERYSRRQREKRDQQ